MQHTIKFLPIVGLALVMGCNTDNAHRNTNTPSTLDRESVQNENDEGTLQFRRTKVAKERDTLSFDIAHPSHVEIELKTPANTGNLRINQIIMPDGTMDGPYGRIFEDSLSQAGTYRLIVGESLMQGDPYAGDYHLKIKID